MHPRDTKYRFATEDDKPEIERLWDTTDIPKFPTIFPEIIAERDGKIIGYIARRYDKQGILIEPMICPNVFVYVRLWNAMEEILERSGIDKFYFRIEPHRVQYEKALKDAEKRGMVKNLGYKDGYTWYERTIKRKWA